MRSLTFGKSLKALLAVATVVVGLASAQPTSAQPYYYQPAPDYYHNDTASGTFLGGAMGAITGAIIGGKHHAGQDALIGAGVGAVTGNLLGRSKDANDDRRAAQGAAAVGQMNAQAAAMAVTDADLVQMTRAGISEDVIISTMRSRGTRIDLSPQSLIALRQQGVNDRVVIAAQQMSAGSGYVPGAPGYGPTVVSEVPPPPAVIVAPAYRPYYYGYYPRPYYYGHYYHPHTVVRVGF
jgi:outer membrane lipoprotein SlyB